MSQQKQAPRPLPSFSRWGQRLWVFAHNYIAYLAGKDDHGLWSVVSQDRQEEPISWNQPSKAEAVRIALDRIDRYGPDYRPPNAPRSDVLGGTTGATT